MKKTILLTLFVLLFSRLCYSQENKYVKLSQDLLQSIKDSKDYSSIIFTISNINPDTLVANLNNDNLRKAFWINMYNSLAQLTITNYKNVDDLSPFFYKKSWMIAREYVCLNEISNSILKRANFCGKYDRRLQVEADDPQIPFALNYGVKECPPIHVFTSQNMDKELDDLADIYIHTNCKYVDSTKTLYITGLFEKYYSSFKRHNGILLLMIKYGIIPDGKDYDNLITIPFNSQVERRKFAQE